MSPFGTMELGELLDALKSLDRDHSVRFGFGYFTPDGIDSYRGYYDHLALGYTEQKAATVGELSDLLSSAVGKKFTGYKGGEFTMDRDTPVWVANYSECPSTAILAVEQMRDSSLVILTTNYQP